MAKEFLIASAAAAVGFIVAAAIGETVVRRVSNASAALGIDFGA